MGSLMAGWDSPVVDTNTAWVQRNRSLTKEDIETFWRSHHKKGSQQEEEGESPATLSSFNNSQGIYRTQEAMSPETVEVDKVNTKGDWWTRSNWAFLNEPPLDEAHRSSNKYAAQFNVAELATKRS